MKRLLAHEALATRRFQCHVPVLQSPPVVPAWQVAAAAEAEDYSATVARYIKAMVKRREMHDKQMARVWFGIHL